MQFKIKLQNTGSVGLHIYREWTIPDCPNKLFYTNQGEEEMWDVLGRDGQLMSEQETLLYLEVMMMIFVHQQLTSLSFQTNLVPLQFSCLP
jgi:hypothetical protein